MHMITDEITKGNTKKKKETLNCNIEYIGKKRNGIPQYYCRTHKSLASDNSGKKLDKCLCPYKDWFDTRINIKQGNLHIKLVYRDIRLSTIPDVIINGEIFKGVLECDDCVLTYKDLGGLMLSKLNHITLEEVICNHCKHLHSDNGKFAYTPHKTHLCQYCGHLFKVKEPNIGNELFNIFNAPIDLQDNIVNISKDFLIEYDLQDGMLLINNQMGDKILLNNKEISIVDYLNNKLKDEY